MSDFLKEQLANIKFGPILDSYLHQQNIAEEVHAVDVGQENLLLLGNCCDPARWFGLLVFQPHVFLLYV